MSSIVLKIPTKSQSFRAALADATIRDRVLEWVAAAVTLDDAVYIPLRTDWLPLGKVPRRTGDGVEVLLGGQWPSEVQQAINSGKAPRIAGALIGRFWGMMCDANEEKSSEGDRSETSDSPAAATVAGAQDAEEEGIASYGLSAPNVEIIGNGEQNEALQADAEPVIPDAEIDAAEPWAPGGDGSDSLTPIVKILEHYGAKWPPGFFDRPIAAVRAGLKKAARSERVRRAARLEREAEEKRQEETKYDQFFTVGKNGTISLVFGEIGARLRERFDALTFNKTLYIYDETTGLYAENMGQVECAVQEIAETVGFTGRITQAKREVLSYVSDYNVETEYPFNGHPGIPVANGVIRVDLAAGEIRLEPYSPGMRFTYRLPVVYDPEASPDHIDQVLRQWVEPGDVPLLYQIPAQAILHQIGRKKPYKKSYLLHGDQDAGKTTYLELLYCAFGAENCAGVALQRIGTDRFYKGALEGKILNTYDDLGDVPFDNTGAFKALTGGFEHDIERKGRDSYKGRIFAVHVFTCNKPPTVDDRNKTDSAFWSRWEYLTFPNSFPRDPSFHERTFTQENVSGFFNRVLEAAIAIAQSGALLVDSSAYVVRDRWSYNSDPLYRFIQGNLERDAKGAIPKDDLYDAYLKFCQYEEVDAAKIPASKDVFAKKIFGYDFGTSKQTVEGKRVQMFTGYTWQVSSQFKPGGTDQARIGGA